MVSYLITILFVGAICRTSWGLNESELSKDPEIAIPEFIQLCVRNAEDINQCIKNSIQQVLPKLANGLPQFGIEPFDPYVRDTFKASLDQEEVHISLSGKNIKLYGGSNGRVQDVRSIISDNTLNMEVDVSFPKFLFEGSYKALGDFSGLSINSRGLFNVSMTDVTTTWKIAGVTEPRNGEDYMTIKSFTMEPEIGDMHIYMDGVFPNNEPLTRLANYVVNQFWRVIYGELKPYATRVWDPVMTDMANRVFQNIPFRRLLPEIKV